MRQLLPILGVLMISTMPLFAQSEKTEEQSFNPHWYMQIQGGVGHTLGEADFGKLLSPAVALSAGRQFTPVWGLRFGISGWEGKGAWFTPSQVYQFNFMQINADVTVDLANWFGGFKYDRTVNPYIFVGLGGNIAFNNDEAQAIHNSGKKLSLLWTNNKFFVAGRAGVGVNFRLCDRLLLGLEVNTNMLPDKFNSKKAGNVDWQMNTLAGLTFRFGKNHKKAKMQPVPIPMPTPVYEQVAEHQIEEPVVVAPAPVVEAAPAPALTPTPDPAPIVKKDAPAPPSPDTYKVRQDVSFTINSSEVRASENAKIEALAQSLKENPKARVSVVGYADAPTGNSKSNYWLSGWRAIHVREALQSKGISPSRVDLDFKGDTEQPYADVEDNRTVICIVR